MKRVVWMFIPAMICGVIFTSFVGCDKAEKIEPEVQSHDEKVIVTDENGKVVTEITVVEDTQTFPKIIEIDFETLEKILRLINEEMMRSLMESSPISNGVQSESVVE